MSETTAVGFRSERGPVLIAVMLSTGLIAIDATILATAVPSIVADIGGFAQFPWLFSIYLLAQAVSVPVYSKLADTIGRKPIMLVGIGLFLVGSILCGFAWDMTSLIVFRAVQGLGAGAVLPVSITITGDIYSVRERARVQGYIASVWAASSVVGPTLGGVFAEFASWRWIFFVNIPLCLIAAFMLWRNYHESVGRQKHRIDYAGASVLTVGLTLVILAVLEGGQAWEWLSWQSLSAFGLGGGLLVAFVFIERRAAEPILPLWVLSRRLILTTSLISLGVGGVLIGLTSYVPTFLEATTDASPIVSGLAVAALTLGWPIAAANAGRLFLRIGFRRTALIGLDDHRHGCRRPARGVVRAERLDHRDRVLHRRPRSRPRRVAHAHRRAVVGAVVRARRRHRGEHVPAIARQRGRRRDLRCGRERRDRPVGARRALPRRDPVGFGRSVPRRRGHRRHHDRRRHRDARGPRRRRRAPRGRRRRAGRVAPVE